MIAYKEFTINTTPVLVSKGHSVSDAKTVMIREQTVTVFLGGDSSVSSATGFPIEVGEVFSLDIGQSDEIWLVAGSSTTVRVIATRSEQFI